MKNREQNPMNIMYKSPYVVLQSGALVVKTTAITETDYVKRMATMDKLITDPPSAGCYKGCIISNNINNLELSYSTGQTPVGVDFDGTVIVVDGESGRKVSTPIITSVEVDTEESNNTLKMTRVQVKCFTLKQLEMFELFFMKPGMNVMVEWGDSSLLKTKEGPSTAKPQTEYLKNGNKISFDPYTRPEQALFRNQNDNDKFEKFCEHFSNMFIPSADDTMEILQNIRRSLGTYEYTAGIIVDYSYSIAEDGTYDVMIEINQSNQLSLAVPKNSTNIGSANKPSPPKKGQKVDFTQIIECVVSDLNLDKSRLLDVMKVIEHTEPKGKWENDFFNFLKTNEQQKDTLSNSDAYISLRYILRILLNYAVSTTDKSDPFRFELPEYIDKGLGKTTNVIPVHSSKFILSSSPDILFPIDQVPLITTGSKRPGDENDIIITSGSKVDGRINGYNFHIEGTYQTIPAACSSGVEISSKNEKVGNALNIFIKYETVVKLWKTNNLRIDFLKSILDIVNKNGYGLFQLGVQPQFQGGRPTIVDYKFCTQPINNTIQESYRFKPTTINSIIRNFSYSFQMDNLMSGRMMFNSNAGLRNAFQNKSTKKKQTAANGPIPFPAESYRSFDYSTYSNADGYYSLNNVDRLKQQKLYDTYVQNSTNTNSNVTNGALANTKTTNTQPPDFTQTINTNSLFFKVSTTPKANPVRLVYKNNALINNAINEEHGPNGPAKSLLTNIDISITIDGFSGFRAGECFNIDGIPEIYNKLGVFQITNIKHSVTEGDGWLTTLEAMWRIGMKN
jgi:hypothetical protein